MVRQTKTSAGGKAADKSVAPSRQATLHLFFGEDEFMVSAAAHRLVTELCPPADQAFGLETIDGAVELVDEAVQVVKRCMDALQTVGFMGGRKVVWFKGVNFLYPSKVGRSDLVKETLAKLSGVIKAGLSPDQILVISAGKVFKNSAFYKTCQTLGKVQEHAVPEKSYQAVGPARAKVQEMFAKAGLKAGDGVIHAFVDRTGFDNRQIVQEAQKLLLYLGERKTVTLEDIDIIISKTCEIEFWDFADAVAGGNLKKALSVLRQLLFQEESPIGLIINLEKRYRDLILLRECMDRRWLSLGGDKRASWTASQEVEEALSALANDPRKGNPYRLSIMAAQAARYTQGQLMKNLDLVLRTHEDMVSGGVASATQLEFMVIKLLKPSSPPVGPSR